MANSYVLYNGTGGSQALTVPFPYLDRDHVSVLVDSVDTPFTWNSDTSIQVTTTAGTANVRVLRTTPKAPLTVFADGQGLVADDLNVQGLQLQYVTEEQEDAYLENVLTNLSVDTSKIANDAVTVAKLSEMAARTVLANDTASTANPTHKSIDDLSVLSDGSTTRRDLSARFADMLNAKDHGLVADGSTNDRAALATLDAASTGKIIFLPSGTYRISSNITLTGTYLFSPGAKLKPDSGVTVTYNGAIFAGGYQVFDITDGTVTGNIDCDRVDCRWFGMVGDGSTNCKRPFDQAVAAAALSTSRTLLIPASGNYYRFTSQPADITSAVTIQGDGMLLTNLLRDHAGSGGTGLFNLRAAGITIRGLTITANTGTSAGSAIALISPSDASYSGLVLEDLWITTLVTDGWGIGIYWDGTAKVSAPEGSRTIAWRNVHVFGASQRNVELKSVINFSWHGGGLYQAGGTSTELLSINGSTIDSQYVIIDIGNINADISLGDCQDVYIKTTALGNITNTSTAIRCKVECTDATSVQSNWVDSVFNGRAYGSVASAGTLTLPKNARVVLVTGTTSITSITAGSTNAGRVVTLVFNNALTLTDGSNLKLSANLVTTADDAITLVCDGTNWYETGRSAN